MNYSEPLYTQVLIFVKSLGSGILIGVMYDVIWCLRALTGTSKRVYIFYDILFCLLSGLYSFFFMVTYNAGIVRFNILVSQAAGALTLHFALGRYLCRVVGGLADSVRSAVRWLFSPFILLWRKIGVISRGAFCRIREEIKTKLSFFTKKLAKKSDNIYKNT